MKVRILALMDFIYCGKPIGNISKRKETGTPPQEGKKQ